MCGAHTLSLVILPHKIYFMFMYVDDFFYKHTVYKTVCMYTRCFAFEYTENDGRATHRKKNLNRFFFH